MKSFNKKWNEYLLEGEFDRTKLTIKDKLSSKFWNRGRLSDEVSSKLIEIAEDFYSSSQESILQAPDLEDITFTGSLASYNYHRASDVDLHILVDFDEMGETQDILARLFALLRIQWNNSHNIKIFGHEVEIYIQDTNEEHFANGVHSILNREWLQMPVKEDIDIDFKTTEKKYNALSLEIAELSKLFQKKEYKKVYDHSNKLKEKIKNMRIAGLEDEGIYSAENLAFKMLRNNEEIKDLMSLRISAYDMMMSVSSEDKIPVNISENWQIYLKSSN
jgi:predicted nucleotidyltransferase